MKRNGFILILKQGFNMEHTLEIYPKTHFA